MGIPHMYKWLKYNDYRGVLRHGVPKYVSSFLFDLNGMLHSVAQLIYAYGEHKNEERSKLISTMKPGELEEQYFQALSTKLMEVIYQVNPQDTLFIAIDGVAPQAKIAQQRQRRFRSAMEREPGTWDSNALSPGTEFMRKIDAYLQTWIQDNSFILPPKIIYSSHMVAGEGEHKIMNAIRGGQIIGRGSHVIYGMDADLVMLSMLAPTDKIFLMREDITDVIDIDSLKRKSVV